MLLALSLLALVLTLGLSAYFLYRVSCDIRYNLGLVVDRLDTMNECNDHAIETQCNIHLDYVQWRNEDTEFKQQQHALRQSEHDAFVSNQEAQRNGATSIAQSMQVIAMPLQMQQPKRSHHKKVVQEQETEQVTEQMATSMVVQESEQ